MFNMVDMNSIGIDTKLARKYNAMINFIKKDTSYNDGCLSASIESIEYTRRNDPKALFKTIDYIKMNVKVFDREYVLWINNPKALHIDRKYNCIDKYDDLEV